LNLDTAASASGAVAISTKPNPRERPVSRALLASVATKIPPSAASPGAFRIGGGLTASYVVSAGGPGGSGRIVSHARGRVSRGRRGAFARNFINLFLILLRFQGGRRM
jgi:hypothetical protein